MEQTAFDLVNDEIDVWLVADCCASRHNQDRDLALERLRHIGCNIATSESVIFNLLGDKNNKSFKEITPLVKKISADMQLCRVSKIKPGGTFHVFRSINHPSSPCRVCVTLEIMRIMREGPTGRAASLSSSTHKHLGQVDI